jgi:hypothetical protein
MRLRWSRTSRRPWGFEEPRSSAIGLHWSRRAPRFVGHAQEIAISSTPAWLRPVVFVVTREARFESFSSPVVEG